MDGIAIFLWKKHLWSEIFICNTLKKKKELILKLFEVKLQMDLYKAICNP